MGEACAPPGLRERRPLAVARGAAVAILLGALISPPLANGAAFTLLLAFALVPSLRRRLAVAMAMPVARAALLMLAVLAAAMLWSDAPLVQRLRAWGDWRPLLLLVFCLAIFDDAAARRRAILAFITIAALVAAASFWAWAKGVSPTGLGHGLPGIVARNSTTQGMGLAAACFLALMLLAGERAIGHRARVLLAAASLLLAANLVFVTSSRSGHLILLLMLGTAAVQLLGGWRRLAVIAALPLLAVVAFGVSPMLQERFGMAVKELRAPLASEQITGMGIRTVMWRVSWQMAGERPILGYGMGGFPGAYERAIKQTSFNGWAATPTVDPHNQYLQVHLQAGVAGSAAFAWFLLCVLRSRSHRPHGAWATALLLAWCAAALATSVFTTFAESHMLMVLLGILLAGTGGTAPAATRPLPPAELAQEASRSAIQQRASSPTRRPAHATADRLHR
jgi:O-antigen ligase